MRLYRGFASGIPLAGVIGRESTSGEFSVTADGGATISGRIVSASEIGRDYQRPVVHHHAPARGGQAARATDRGRLSPCPVTAFT